MSRTSRLHQGSVTGMKADKNSRTNQTRRHKAKMRRNKSACVVYGLFADDGVIAYIGQTRCLLATWTRVFGGVRAMADLKAVHPSKFNLFLKDGKRTPESILRGKLKNAKGPQNSRCDSLLRKFD